LVNVTAVTDRNERYDLFLLFSTSCPADTD
jgi:hypothetical protein